MPAGPPPITTTRTAFLSATKTREPATATSAPRSTFEAPRAAGAQSPRRYFLPEHPRGDDHGSRALSRSLRHLLCLSELHGYLFTRGLARRDGSDQKPNGPLARRPGRGADSDEARGTRRSGHRLEAQPGRP